MNTKLQEITAGLKQAGLRTRHHASTAQARDTNDTNEDFNSSGNRTDGDIQLE
jgi:hypothetical protein